MWKFESWKGKDKCLFLLVLGVILCILAFPAERVSKNQSSGGKTGTQTGEAGTFSPKWEKNALSMETTAMGSEAAIAASADTQTTYEAVLERRVKDVLKHVEGVGTVDVLIVLKTSAEKVVQTDLNHSRSVTQEQDSSGGTRKMESEEQEQSAVFTGTDSGKAPVIQKEVYPEISGIVVSAAGGGEPSIAAEITAAMEALFGLPANKIKVLKRVE